MDRFIVGAFIYILVALADLKSSMDRFIESDFYCDYGFDMIFKIQYG